MIFHSANNGPISHFLKPFPSSTSPPQSNGFSHKFFFHLFLISHLTLSLWRGKKYDSSGVSTFLYYFCKSQSKISKIPHNALLSISDLILDNWELWDHPFNHSRVGWGQISPFAINQLYYPHTSKRWHRK